LFNPPTPRDGYFGDEIPQAILARLIDLELDFGIECFADPRDLHILY